MKYFIYNEHISTKKRIEPLINCSINKNQNAIYLISDYFYNLNSSEVIILNSIYEYSKKVSKKKEKDTINKESWLKYMVSHNIKVNALSKRIQKSSIIVNEDNTVSVDFGINSKFNKLSFNNSELYLDDETKFKLKPLFEIPKNPTNEYEENKLFLYKEGTYEKEIDLLFMVLDCLFSSNYDFYIKKCDLCNNFYFTAKINKRYCERKRIVCNKNTTCQNSLNILNQSKEYICIRRLKSKHLDIHYKNGNLDYINKFMGKYNRIIDNCKEKRDISQNDLNEIIKITSSSD